MSYGGGSAPTFVLGQEGAEVLEAGRFRRILSEAELQMLSRKLWDGDHIIMVTDGVLDVLRERIRAGYVPVSEKSGLYAAQEMGKERDLNLPFLLVPSQR